MMIYEVGAVLGDAKWQAPSYCFTTKEAVNGQSLELAVNGSFKWSLPDGVMKGFMDQ